MDGDRFDRFAKTVAARSPSRRGLLAGTLGGALALVGRRSAAAATCCTGNGARVGGATGGRGRACCGPSQHCLSRDGRVITCPGRQRAEGGRAGCCTPGDTACQQRILTPPPCPQGCSCA